MKFKNEALTETIQFFLGRIRVTSELTCQALISKRDPADSPWTLLRQWIYLNYMWVSLSQNNRYILASNFLDGEYYIPYFYLILILLISTKFKFIRVCNIIRLVQLFIYHGVSDWPEVSTPNSLWFKSTDFTVTDDSLKQAN